MKIFNKEKLKEPIKLHRGIIAPVSKENGIFRTHLEDYPETECLLEENIAINIEKECYYESIKLPGYYNMIEILKKAFKDQDKKELYFFLTYDSIGKTVRDKKQLKKIKKILEQYQNGELKDGNTVEPPEKVKHL